MKVETPILRRLGPVPFWRGTTRCLDELERTYRKAIEAARTRLGGVPDAGAAARTGRKGGADR